MVTIVSLFQSVPWQSVRIRAYLLYVLYKKSFNKKIVRFFLISFHCSPESFHLPLLSYLIHSLNTLVLILHTWNVTQ